MDTRKLFLYDKRYKLLIAGCDEAGRGPLAGPVVCAACVMPLEKSNIKKSASDSKNLMIDGINDSKQLSEKKRESLFEKIIENVLDCSVSVINPDIIDKINILQATKQGMTEAINGLKMMPELVLIDAVTGLDIAAEYKSIIKGDAYSYNIAAASILAKVTRDRLMCDYDLVYPGYGFSQNKGYATKQHIEAIRRLGPSPIHRKLFIRNALRQQLEFNFG